LYYFICLYYTVEIIVLFERQETFLKVIEILLFIITLFTAVSSYRNESSRPRTLINGCIFGMNVGWLCYASSSVSSKPSVPVFFSFNGIAILLLTCLDIKEHKNLVLHDAMSDEATNEHPARDDLKPIPSASSEDTASTHINNTSRSNNFSDTTGRDVENGYDSNSDGRPKCALKADNFDGFRVKLEMLPISNSVIPSDVPWESFSYLRFRVDSSSCHIYSAFWRGVAVIIKLIKADRVSSPMAVAEFETEASVLTRLDHPHIVKLLGSGRQPRRFLILELLDGGSLSHTLGLRADTNNKVSKKKFKYLETLQLARSLASSLDYLHNHWHSSIHVIHRDLKPDNIGFTADGKLKLFDFGLCACVRTNADRKDQYRLTGNTGTLRYMAPEVALGRQYNSSVDVYSFGVIIWQVLRAKVPFREMGKKAYIQEVVVGGRRPPLDRRWPEGFSSLLQKCWHEDKDLRPSFSVVVSELDALIHEAQGKSSVSMSMQISYTIRKAKSGITRYLVRFYTLFMVLALLLELASLSILILGDQLLGSCLAIIPSAVLYIGGMKYIQRKARGSHDDERKIAGLRFGAQRFLQLFTRGRRRSSNDPVPEIKRRPSARALAMKSSPIPSSSCVSTCLGGEESQVAFNPLSPHSLHHSSDGDELEGHYQTSLNGERDRVAIRPSDVVSI
jgi:serine/threonine protein kinase